MRAKFYQHFLDFGIKEGRQAHPVFDLQYYLSANSDLQAAFGNDYVKGMNHYLTFGYKEIRKTEEPCDLGSNFFAKITSVKAGKNLSLQDTNVIIYTPSDKPAQVWNFIRQADGSYEIVNMKDGKSVLTVEDGKDGSGANVQLGTDDDTKAQRFYIYDTGSNYILKAACSKVSVLDVAGGKTEDCTNIQQYDYNGSTAQQFKITKTENSSQTVFDNMTPADLGSKFYAKISWPKAGLNFSLLGNDVITYPASDSAAQVWEFIAQEDGSYKIVNQKTGLVLEVADSTGENGVKVRTGGDNDSANQRFFFYEVDGLYVVRNAATEDCVLDVKGGSTAECTNIQQYQFNNTLAQKFAIEKISSYFDAIAPVDVGESFLANIVNRPNPGFCIGVSDSNIVLDKIDGSSNQIWKFIRQSDMSYEIVSMSDGVRVMDVYGASSKNSANVRLYQDNDSEAQRFFVYPQKGGYVLRPACSSTTVVDIANGTIADQNNIATYEFNGTRAQIFDINKVEPPKENPFGDVAAANLGDNFIAKIGWTSTLNVGVGSTNVALVGNSNNAEEYWRFVRQTDGSYVIINQYNGYVLEVTGGNRANGTNVQVAANTGSDNQRWFIYATGSKYWLKPASSDAGMLDVSGSGDRGVGTNIHQYEFTDLDDQKFTITKVDYFAEVKPENLGSGFYANIASTSGLYLGLSDTNVLLKTASTSDVTQTWRFIRQSEGSYVIVNCSNEKVLDLAGGLTANGTNVQVYTNNGTTAQKWYIYRVDGRLTIRTSKKISGSLDVAGGKLQNGTNVQLYAYSGSAAQLFDLKNISTEVITYRVTSPYNTNCVGTYSTLDQAKATANSRVHYGYVVFDSTGQCVYTPATSLNASKILWQAKLTADYQRDNRWVYGDASTNPYFNKSEKVVSCDRFVGWTLGNAGYTNGQPSAKGLNLFGHSFNLGNGSLENFLIQNGFTKITDINQVDAGDIVFVGYSYNNLGLNSAYRWYPQHVFICASSYKAGGGITYRYDLGSLTRIRSTQPSREALSQSGNVFRFAYRAPSTGNIQSASNLGSTGACGVTISDSMKSYVFDANYYSDTYADLQAAFGEDETKLYNHFLNYGIKEGRQGNALFDVKYYLSANADLKEAYGTDYVQGMKHYLNCGYKEKRVTAKPVDVGTNFYANVSVAGTKLNLSVSGTNVLVNTASSGLAQVWKFVRQSDGSYSIISMLTNQVLDVTNGEAASGTNVQVYNSNGTKAQKWYIYETNGGYVLRSACSGGCVLDLAGGSKKDNTNVQQYTYNGTTAQKFTITEVELDLSQVVYYVCSPYNTNRIGTYSDLNQAKSVAKSKQQYGYVVYDSNSAFVYSPASSLDASRIVWEAKWVADYSKANNYNYGHAQINPAISAGTAGCEKLSSCDRFVGWALYRAGWTDQPYKYGFTSDFCSYLRSKGFSVITNPKDLLPGDIVFVGYAGQPEPYGHVFLYAGASSNGNHYRYDAGSVDRIRCVGTYASYNSTGQPFNQPLELSSGSVFRIAYRCPATNKGYSSSDAADSNKLILTDEQKAMVFDAEYYSNNNADLKAAYGTDATKLYNHFLNFGIKEGRQGNAVFDVKYYLSVHADLKAAYSTDYVLGLKHYLNFGYKEQRVTAKPIDLGTNFYAKLNISGTNLNLSLSDTNVIAYTASNKPAQLWRFVRQSDGSYCIINQKTGQALDVEGASATSGSNVQIYNLDGTKAQKWYIYQTSGGYVLRAACSGGAVLDLTNGSKTAGTNIRQYTYNGTTAQKYSIVKVDYFDAVDAENLGDSFYAKITAAGNTNMNLSLSDSNVILYSNSTKPAQVWKFERQSDGSYKIINQKDGSKVLDVYGGYSKAGSNVQIYADNGSAAQRWLIYVKEGNYVLRPTCSDGAVLDIENGVMSDMANIQIYTLNSSIAQAFKIVKTGKPGETTDSDMEVLRKIIYAVETGGQVYGNVRYDAFTEAYANTSLEHAITIGGGQWFGNEAKRLLNLIRTNYPETFASLDTEGIAYDLDHCDWSTYKLSAGSAKAKCIQRIISSAGGIKIQDQLIDEQMAQYMAEARALGVTDIKAQMMCANIRHLGGLSAVKRILAKISAPYTLDNIYAAMQSDTGNQVGAPKFQSRHRMVYNVLNSKISK